MARHAKRNTIFVIASVGRLLDALPDGPPSRRSPGDSWSYGLAERGFAQNEAVAPRIEVLRRVLEVMRRAQMEEGEGPVGITCQAIERTVEFVLDGGADEADVAGLEVTVTTLRGYLAAVADKAEEELDTGRAVVREMVRRARCEVDGLRAPTLLIARRLAQTTRDLVALLGQSGWDDVPCEAAS